MNHERDRMAMKFVLCFAIGLTAFVDAQSNYNDQAISISYEGEGLPVYGTLNGTVTELDQISPKIYLNRTEAILGCADGVMNVDLKFKRAFYGIVYADFDRNSACKITGNGSLTGTINLPLKGCGTLQSPVRVFTNNIIVRFHPGLEIEGDEVITIICRYPPPLVPLPIVPVPLAAPITPVRALQPLREFEILLIICAIIFLALLLLGIGCSYYCLKKRNIKVVRRRPASTLGSEVTKMSEPVSMFGGLKIPRAHATDTSGSEQLTESIHSEFPSEVASAVSEEEYHSTYSDQACELAEGAIITQLQEPGIPGFDVKTIVKKAKRGFSPVSSRASSESGLVLKAQEQYLTTILERTETNTLETLERVRRVEAKKGPPPVHARIRVHNRQVSDNSESESEFSQAQSDYYDQDMFLQSKDTQNLILDQKNEFDVDIKTKYDNSAFSHSDEDTSTVFSEPIHRSYGRTQMDIDLSARRNNFDVLIRILDPPPEGGDDLSSVITEDERIHLREVILQDVQVQKMIQTATTTEEFAVIRNHQSIQRVLPPQKWDVLIRVLQNPSFDDDRSERASTKSTFTGYSSVAPGHDVRSMSEIMVDFSAENMSRYTHEGVVGDPSYVAFDPHESSSATHAQYTSSPDTSDPKAIADAMIRYVTTTDHKGMSKPEYVGDFKSIRTVTSYSSDGAQARESMEFPSAHYATEKTNVEVHSEISGISRGPRSVADRSGTEITEYHHYSTERSRDDFTDRH